MIKDCLNGEVRVRRTLEMFTYAERAKDLIAMLHTVTIFKSVWQSFYWWFARV